jgi:hypothetical protein
VDLALGASAAAVGAAAAGVRRARPIVGPVAGLVARPPLVPAAYQPAAWAGGLVVRGSAVRRRLLEELDRLTDILAPRVVSEVLRRIDLTDLVLQHVDLDRVVAAVDLDEAVRRVDVEAVVARVDVDEVARRLDVEAVVRRVDVDAVARRLDLDGVLDRLDLTAEILRRVELDVLVEEILARVDLVALSTEVIDAVDLPEIIRESTGSMASDTVRGARMQGIAADEAVSRAVDRLLLRRGRRGTPVPEQGGPTP